MDVSLKNARAEISAGVVHKGGGIVRLTRLVAALPAYRGQVMPLLRQTLAAAGTADELELESQITAWGFQGHVLAMTARDRTDLIRIPRFGQAIGRVGKNKYESQNVLRLLRTLAICGDAGTRTARLRMLDSSADTAAVTDRFFQNMSNPEAASARADLMRQLREGTFPRLLRTVCPALLLENPGAAKATAQPPEKSVLEQCLIP